MWLIGKAPSWHVQGPGFNPQHWNEGWREGWQAGYYVKSVPIFFFIINKWCFCVGDFLIRLLSGVLFLVQNEVQLYFMYLHRNTGKCGIWWNRVCTQEELSFLWDKQARKQSCRKEHKGNCVSQISHWIERRKRIVPLRISVISTSEVEVYICYDLQNCSRLYGKVIQSQDKPSRTELQFIR